jgi:formylglycine-generating enzyme required for sulfatase activity
MGPDIFISFARDDLDRVEPLIKAGESLGYSVWRDTDLLSPGASWAREIEDAIAAARCVLVIWTAATSRSPALLVDAARASVANKLLSVWLDPIDPSVQLLNIPHIDLAGWGRLPGHAGFQRLTSDIAKLAGPPSGGASAAQNETQPRPTRRMRIPDIDWVEIPGGPFRYQQGETRELPSFWIGRYPVTNAQYRTFIDDGGYYEPLWWRDLECPKPEAPRWPQPNRPRTNVDWYEGVAFTRWLTARLGLPEGSIRLPTELE